MTEPDGGFILWVELPPAVDTLELRLDALEEKIGTAPGPMFTMRDQFRNCIRLNCGLRWTGEFERAIQTLGRLASRQIDKKLMAAKAG